MDYQWHKIPGTSRHGVSDLPAGSMRPFSIDRKKLCLVRSGEKAYVINEKCPHSGASLHKGFLEENCVVCPLHRYKFSLEDGKNVSGEGLYLENYPVEKREDGLYVGLPKKKFLGLF